ncbi:MAG: hypothetical protein GXN92_01485 [Candidatus Micrarchaeota archaeon]|nr:hypothetical protein [Candidatus Micrarchaeota archaeon]
MLYEIEFEIRDKNGNIIESTQGEIGKKLYGKEGPLLVIPEHLKVPALREFVERAKEGEEMEEEVPPEKAYQHRDRRLVKKVSTAIIEHGDRLAPGMYVAFGDVVGKVIAVSPGRATIDFNHPYAGKPVIVKAKLLKVYKDPKEIVERIISHYGLDVKAEWEDNKLKLEGEDKEKLKEYLMLYKVNVDVE